MSELTKSDIKKVWLGWLFNNQACYNYERMMGIGFLNSMNPAIKRLYADDPDETTAALERHGEFFNCEPCLGSSIVGLSLAMEEQKAKGADIEPDAIRSIKTGLMGPLSGVGDSLIQGVIVPLLLGLAVEQATNGNIAAPIIYIIVITFIILAISYSMFQLGYRKGSDAVLDMLEGGTFKRVVSAAGIMGCMVLGALICKYVTLKCGIVIPQGDTEFNFQTGLFDVLCPSMLPLLLTLGCYKLLDKGMSASKVLIVIVVLGIVGGLLGIFAAS